MGRSSRQFSCLLLGVPAKARYLSKRFSLPKYRQKIALEIREDFWKFFVVKIYFEIENKAPNVECAWDDLGANFLAFYGGARESSLFVQTLFVAEISLENCAGG